MSEASSSAPTPPISEDELVDQLNLQVVDMSQGVQNATDHAEQFINEQTTQRGFGGFVKRVWYGNVGRDYVLQREERKGRERIVEEQNIYALQGATNEEYQAASASVVERISGDYLHEGDTNEEMASVPHGEQLRDQLHSLVTDFARGLIDEEVLTEEKTRLLEGYGQAVQAEDRKKGLIFADNVIDVARHARAAFDHGVGVSRIEAAMRSRVGEARLGARTEAHRSATDRVVDKLYNTKVGSMVNETTLATAAAVGISVGKFVGRKAATVAGAFLGMGVGVGVIAGVREHARVGKERQAHLRERAEGGLAPEIGSKRREKLETTKYETATATSLTSALERARAAVDAANPATIQATLNTMRDVEARVRLSDSRSIDLIQYSSKTSLEAERLGLDVALALSKVELTRMLAGLTDEQLEDAGLISRDADELLGDRLPQTLELLSDVNAKDAAFSKLRRNRVMAMAACGFVSSVTMGATLQEVKALVSDDLQGVFEHDTDGQSRRTLLAGVFKGSTSTESYVDKSFVTENVPRTPDEYIDAHPDKFTHVHRELWFANDTHSTFDKNELKLHWGGQGGVDADGNYVFNVAHMTADGSYENGLSTNAQQLVGEDRMKIALSMTRGTQNNVFFVDVDANGNAHIGKDSFIGQSLFETDANGHAQYNGAFAEAVELTGQEPDGRTNMRMLATVVGENNPKSGMDQITKIITTEGERTVGKPIELPFVAPINGRRGLEKLPTRPERVYYNYGYNRYGPQSPEEIEDLIHDTLPALRDDPRADIRLSDAVEHYEGVLRDRYSDEYVEELKEIVNTKEGLANIDGNTKAILAIPVEAIGEGDNIYKTLKLYAQMSPEELTSTSILLHLNWITSRATSPEVQAKIQHTRDEIARAMADFPGLKISTFESQWTDEQKNAGNGVIGLAVRKLYDVAIMTAREGVASGRVGEDQEIVLIRNDADPNGMSPNYIANMVRATTQPGRDVTVGKFKWAVEKAANLPGLAVAAQFLSGIQNSAERAMAKGIGAGVPTSGANMGVRLSVLAAVGSVGFGQHTGAGSDDIHLGERVNALRRRNSPTRRTLYSRISSGEYGRTPSASGARSGYLIDDAIDDETGTIGRGPGLVIDTDASRLERMYRSGESIVKAWIDYDDDGYLPRDSGLATDAAGESLRDNSDIVMSRIEFQINSLITGWGMDAAHVEMELRRLFPSNKPGEEPMYATSFNENGIIQFHFTASGKNLLLKRLTRNNRGEFDPIGSRRLRVNYGRSTGKRIFPAGATPHLVGV